MKRFLRSIARLISQNPERILAWIGLTGLVHGVLGVIFSSEPVRQFSAGLPPFFKKMFSILFLTRVTLHSGVIVIIVSLFIFLLRSRLSLRIRSKLKEKEQSAEISEEVPEPSHVDEKELKKEVESEMSFSQNDDSLSFFDPAKCYTEIDTRTLMELMLCNKRCGELHAKLAVLDVSNNRQIIEELLSDFSGSTKYLNERMPPGLAPLANRVFLRCIKRSYEWTKNEPAPNNGILANSIEAHRNYFTAVCLTMHSKKKAIKDECLVAIKEITSFSDESLRFDRDVMLKVFLRVLQAADREKIDLASDEFWALFDRSKNIAENSRNTDCSNLVSHCLPPVQRQVDENTLVEFVGSILRGYASLWTQTNQLLAERNKVRESYSILSGSIKETVERQYGKEKGWVELSRSRIASEARNFLSGFVRHRRNDIARDFEEIYCELGKIIAVLDNHPYRSPDRTPLETEFKLSLAGKDKNARSSTISRAGISFVVAGKPADYPISKQGEPKGKVMFASDPPIEEWERDITIQNHTEAKKGSNGNGTNAYINAEFTKDLDDKIIRAYEETVSYCV